MSASAREVPRKGYIFLSHAGADIQAARQFAEILRRNGVEVWFDNDNLNSGDPWMATLEDAISAASGMIVYIGGNASFRTHHAFHSIYPHLSPAPIAGVQEYHGPLNN
jgi:deoxyribodipyrimidine photolyase-like uncharacterized protein